jgi:hypothetical protein|tara:strand:- start:58 stop:639 length:582 start_codon:yes stop_codon:yes gene_type:complete
MSSKTYDPETKKEYVHENEYDYRIQRFCELGQYVKHEEEVIDFAFSLRDKLINDLENKDDAIRLKYIKWIEDEYLLRTKDFMVQHDISIPKNLIHFKAFKFENQNLNDKNIEETTIKEDWNGTLYNLADEMRWQYDKLEHPQASSLMDVYRWAEKNYTYQGGKEVKASRLAGAWHKAKADGKVGDDTKGDLSM